MSAEGSSHLAFLPLRPHKSAVIHIRNTPEAPPGPRLDQILDEQPIVAFADIGLVLDFWLGVDDDAIGEIDGEEELSVINVVVALLEFGGGEVFVEVGLEFTAGTSHLPADQAFAQVRFLPIQGQFIRLLSFPQQLLLLISEDQLAVESGVSQDYALHFFEGLSPFLWRYRRQLALRTIRKVLAQLPYLIKLIAELLELGVFLQFRNQAAHRQAHNFLDVILLRIQLVGR